MSASSGADAAGLDPRASGVTLRRATAADLPGILAVAARSLGWPDTRATATRFAWKHAESPFGTSVIWVAEADGRLVGVRPFMRWELVDAAGERVRAARAVDAAVDEAFRRRGLFSALTRAGLDDLRADGVDLVFNTPNDRSGPGNLKLGWRAVGHLPAAVRPSGVRGLARLPFARTPAARDAVPTAAGEPAAAFLADPDRAAPLLGAGPGHLRTRRTPAYLAWRYGAEDLHYRVVTAPAGSGAGVAVFHLRQRGPAREAVVCELVVPTGAPATARELCRRIAHEAGADHLLRLRAPSEAPGALGFWPVPGGGPLLLAREVGRRPPTTLAAWGLTMGDVELF